MRSVLFIATTISAALMVSACGQAPSNICEMPQNRHFWQGLKVKWQGPILEIEENHGGGIWLTSRRCGATIEVDRATVPTLFEPENGQFGFMAVADFEVKGRLIFKDGRILLSASSLNQKSAWWTDEDDNFDMVMKALDP